MDKILGSVCERFWKILRDFERFWNILRHYERFERCWKILKDYERFCENLFPHCWQLLSLCIPPSQRGVRPESSVKVQLKLLWKWKDVLSIFVSHPEIYSESVCVGRKNVFLAPQGFLWPGRTKMFLFRMVCWWILPWEGTLKKGARNHDCWGSFIVLIIIMVTQNRQVDLQSIHLAPWLWQ